MTQFEAQAEQHDEAAARLSHGLDRIEALERRIRAAQAEQLAVIEQVRADAGVANGLGTATAADRDLATRSFIAELATVMHVPEGTAGRLVATASALAERPATAAGLASGAFGLRHVETILEAVQDLPELAAAAVEAVALEQAPRLTNAALRRRLRRVRERLHPQPLEVRRARTEADRRVWIEPAPDGMAWINLFLPAERAVAIRARLEADAGRIVEREQAAARDAATDSPMDTVRTRAQVEADLAAALLLGDGGTAESGRPFGVVTPRVVVTVPVLSLLGVGDEPADLEGYGPIDAATARRIAAHAPSFHRILTDPETGAHLSYGRSSYRVPADLARMLAVRDGGCRFPGCGRRAASCDLDHTTAWVAGGRTDHDNLAHLCRKHHRLKHETAWRVTQRDGGILEWASPAGRTYRSDPEHLGPPARGPSLPMPA